MLRKMKEAMLIVVVALLLLCQQPVYAYDGISVSIPVKGESGDTYILIQDEKEIQHIKGTGTFTLKFNEPGTYSYQIADKSNTKNLRDVKVYIVNDEQKDTGLVTEAVEISKNGKKTDSVDFTKPKPKKDVKKPTAAKTTPANAGRPKTGDQVAPLVASVVMLLSASAILVIVAGERRKDEER